MKHVLIAAIALLCATVQAERKLFVFDNGLTDVTSVEEQAKLLKGLGYDGICTRPPKCTPEFLAAFDKHDVSIMASYVTLPPKPGELPGYLEGHFKQLEGRGAVAWLGISNEKADEQPAVETIQKVCDLAAKYGLEVVLYPHIHFRTDTIERTERLRKLADRKNLGISFNLCHFFAQNEESRLEETIRRLAPHLKIIQISGADRPVPGGSRNMDNFIKPLGEGSFDMNRVFQVMEEIGYNGPVGLQCYRIPEPAEEHLKKSMNAWRKYNEQP